MQTPTLKLIGAAGCAALLLFLGQYTVGAFINPGSISGQKFNDLNGNGTRDAGEPGLPGWTIYLDNNRNGVLDTGEQSAVTDSTGNYQFSFLFPASYRVREVLQSGWRQTTPNPPDINIDGTDATGVDFGNFQLIIIGGEKFNDLNGNGIKDAADPALGGWTIELLNASDGRFIANRVTDGRGGYAFTSVGPGTYKVREVAQPGWVQTTANPADIAAVSGQNRGGVNFGNFQTIMIAGQKFHDANGNGTRGAGEPGLPGWVIQLSNASTGQLLGSATTAASGNYSFLNLGPGTYRVREVAQAGWVQTSANPADIVAASGQNVAGVDFGNRDLDTTAPTIACSPDIVTNTSPGQCSRIINFPLATATDARDPNPTVTCSPPSGSVFPKGTTTVTCTARDASGNTSTCTFTVTVNDTEAPSFACPPNMSVAADPGQCSRAVTFPAPTVSDNCPGTITVAFTPPSGSVFSNGTTVVFGQATDAAGNRATCTFTVTVFDNEKPAITCPPNMVVTAAAGRSSAEVTYPAATVTDNCDSAPNVTFTPPSGSTFPVGTTIVTVRAMDRVENSSICAFTVTVKQLPTISIADVVVVEGATGTTDAVFALNLSAPSTDVVTVGFTTVEGSATQNADFQISAGSVRFNPGQTEASIVVVVNSDSENEPDETFFVQLINPVNATFLDSQAVGTIRNAPGVDLALEKTSAPNPVELGSPLTYTITVRNSLPGPVTGLVLTDMIPTGFDFVSAAPDECAPAPPNDRFLTQVYLDLLHRPLDPAAHATLGNLLNQGTTRQQVAASLLNSAEYRHLLVGEFYQRFLRRAADPAGLDLFASQLAGNTTVEQVIAALVGSPEYFASRGAGTNDLFLDALYADLLNRPVDTGARQAWNQALSSGVTRAQIAATILDSEEYQRLLVQGFYQRFLRRAADNAGLNAFVAALRQGGTDAQVMSVLIGSEEYLGLAVEILTCPLGDLSAGAVRTVRLVVTPMLSGSFTNTASVRSSDLEINSQNNVASAVTQVGGPVPPTILTQPQSQRVPLGATVALAVTVRGTPPFRYQWRLNGVNVPGANGPTLPLNNLPVGRVGKYQVIVGNAAGTVESDAALVTLQNVPDLPLTNEFNQRVVLNDVARTGLSSNVNATKEPGEPNHAGKPGGKSMWLTWLAPADGVARFSTAGSSFDTLLAVYTGDSLATLVEVASDEDRAQFLTSQLDFFAVAGTRYQIAVDGFNAASGDIVLGWSLEPTPDLLPDIRVHAVSQTVGLGRSASFSVTAIGAGLTYQWFFNGAPLPGATTPALAIPNVQRANIGNYFVRINRGARFIDSKSARLEINTAARGTIVELALTEDKFADLFQAAARVRSPVARSGLAPKRRKTSLARGYSGTQLFSSVGSVSEPGEPNHCGVIGGASQWFAYLPEANGLLTINTDGSDFDTVLAVYTGSGADFASLVSVACDNDSGLDGLDSRVSFPVQAGTILYIVVDGVAGVAGNVQLNYDLSAPPAVKVLPRTGLGFPGLQSSGQPGRTYRIEGSADFVNWVSLLTTNSSPGVFNFNDLAPGMDFRYYRAVMQP